MSTSYNERSWAIDLISEINRYVSSLSRPIRRAGGERTLSDAKGKLFPDVLLYGDSEQGSIVQGWELKFPDTPLTDPDLIENATRKATLLGLNSFVLWNVTVAELWIADATGTFVRRRTWPDLAHITKRADVESAGPEWRAVLASIVDSVNDYLERGEVTPRSIVDAFSDDAVVNVILLTAAATADALRAERGRDARFAAEVDVWWSSVKKEYPGEGEPLAPLSRLILTLWINRFVFGHYLKRFATDAAILDTVTVDTSVEEAAKVFGRISETCDFLNVFRSSVGESVLAPTSWQAILELNGFLVDLRFEAISQELLQMILERTISAGRRKSAGQYATPPALAELLVRLALNNKHDHFLDPCCGSGTIPRAAYGVKREFGESASDALATTWASDKFAYPLQLATLALSEPEAMGDVVHVFRSDVTELSVGRQIAFIDPHDGSGIQEGLPTFGGIASNLPFVRFEDLAIANPGIAHTAEVSAAHAGVALPGRSDLYAYIPFLLWPLLSATGKLGIIVSNSWLGTEWGESFRTELEKVYTFDTVVTSASGRWFANADVVTTIIILNKRLPAAARDHNEVTRFVSLKKSIEELATGSIARDAANDILLGTPATAAVQTRQLSRSALDRYGAAGLQWNAFFSDLSWFDSVAASMVKASTLFTINRGERRGWDPLFYPGTSSGIEARFLRPVLKSPRSVKGLVAIPDGVAFCCGDSKTSLKQNGHTGALAWIQRFDGALNETGKPLTEVLKRRGAHWYEMSDDTVADLVTMMNPEDRLFVARMKKRGFVNQRLIRFTRVSPNVDIDLCHALLNSTLGMFYLEALGFGRGLGVLDLNSTKLASHLKILDPSQVDPGARAGILTAFGSLLSRAVMPLKEELASSDRQHFDDLVLGALGLERFATSIRDSLLELYTIRQSVHDR